MHYSRLYNEHVNLESAACDEWNMEILNKTIADGNVTWQNKEQKSAIYYVLVKKRVREDIESMAIDENREFGISIV